MRLSEAAGAEHGAGTAQRVAASLRDRIAGGGLKPGEQLPEAALAEAYGVSRNTVREAFRLLLHERLVVHEFNRGVFVRVPAPADIVDIYAVRCALETAGVRAAGQASPPLLAEVLRAVEEGEKAAANGDWPHVADAGIRFHRALAALAGSPRTDCYMSAILAELRLVFQDMPSPAHLHEPFVGRNRAIAELVRRSELSAAEAELTSYLADSRQLILDTLNAQAEERA
ncbi:GntR family transcriptional regulator [Streptomyces candidus]|uniref:DNA-binding GntR family transcriptional regulator n=1 Tax=Streptomyces candidus TaxID=67283 RepID=A0A7X0HB66_9ACTN|nr:GntR family transcriptional regulator [Streptomyces candidus]MBB6434417.1 DNA-binding GntR family transcriptional regulator [Streptomyces candidus]GHH36786.1 GntR family transcriptional regulator [Streptomyces candidus]